MKELTCVIVGGGHAGIRALQAIRESTEEMAGGRRLRFVLIDKQPHHVRKVLLFRPAVGEEAIAVPWTRWFPEGVHFVQGNVAAVDVQEKRIRLQDAAGREDELRYDLLVVAVGSVIRRPDPSQGGIALTDPDAALKIRDRWKANLRMAAAATNHQERKRLMTVALVGAGISGIEMSAELAPAMRTEAAKLGLNPADVTVYLLNERNRLFQEGPAKVGRRLDRILSDCGVQVLHRRKALFEDGGVLTLQSGDKLPVGLCVWTIGLMPNPALRGMGLPLTAEGQVVVDECYRIQGASGAYSVGDCARVVDPVTGKADRMTCKEGNYQAIRLGKIVAADLEGRPAPAHKSVPDFFCIGLGHGQGLVWTRKWGIDMIMTGKLAWRIKNFTWDKASMMR